MTLGFCLKEQKCIIIVLKYGRNHPRGEAGK